MEALRGSEAARQSSMRRLNEQTSIARLGSDDGNIAILCECGRDACTAEITLSSGAYRNIRRQGGWLVIADGHERLETHRVVLRKDCFTIVEANLGSNLPAPGER